MHQLLQATLVTGAALALAVQPLQASLITLNSGGTPQPANSGKGTIEEWIKGLVITYNDANPNDLPLPGEEVFRVTPAGESPSTPPSAYSTYPTYGAGTLTITIPTGDFDYIGLHWGGKGGGTYQAFYIGDIGGAPASEYTFTAPGKNGLSWYDTLHANGDNIPVGDVGSTVTMLGVALMGLTQFRRVAKAA